MVENFLNFSRYPYCANLHFDEATTYTNYFFSGARQGSRTSDYKQTKASILYNAKTEDILATGDEADYRKFSEADENTVFYINNIMIKLNDIYLKNAQDHNAHDRMTLAGVVLFLQNLTKDYSQGKTISHKSYLDYHFAVTLPTHWDLNIREKMLRPLFIQAGLVSADDHHDRLLFFSQLDGDFRHLQSLDHNGSSRINTRLANGRQYVMYKLKLVDRKLIVTMDLFSAHYPAVTAIDDKYVSKALHSVYFTVSLDPMSANNFNSGIIVPINVFFDNTLASTKEIFIREMNKVSTGSDGRLVTAIIITPELRMGIYASFEHQFVFILRAWLKEYDQEKFNNDFMTFGKELAISSDILIFDTMERTEEKIRQQIQVSNKRRPPSIIAKSNNADENLSNRQRPNHLINLDITYKEVSISCVFTENKKAAENSMNYEVCDIQPLDNFFIQSSLYQRPVLQLTNRLKVFMEDHFDDLMNISLERNQHTIKNNYMYQIINRAKLCRRNRYLDITADHLNAKKIQNNRYMKAAQKVISKLSDNTSMLHSFFAPSSISAAHHEKLTCIHQEKYIHLFYLMYMGYLNTLIDKKLQIAFGNNWKNANTGYIISLEKKMMHMTRGSKYDARNLVINSGVLPVLNNAQKPRLVVRGEGILSALQKKLKLTLPVKSYFSIVQLNHTHIEVALHQVVDIETPERSASSIILEDRILSIENVIDSTCKNIWKHITLHDDINYCALNNAEANITCDVLSLQNYFYAIEKLKLYFSKIVEFGEPSLDKDEIKQLQISKTCDCTIHITLRNIIDIGLKPVIQNITTVIAASIVNTDLFGDYIVDHLFILGDIFTVSNGAPLYNVHRLNLQKSIAASIRSKEQDTQGYVLKETLHQLLQPTIGKQPYMYDSFVKGDLYQVASETYGLCIKLESYNREAAYFISCQKDSILVSNKKSAMIILQTGQMIPHTGVRLKFNVKHKYMETYLKEMRYMTIEFIRLRHSKEDRLKDVVSLEKYSYDSLSTFEFPYSRYHGIPLRLMIKSVNYNSSLQFIITSTGADIDPSITLPPHVVLEEHLSLAYF
ncbi:uncharacterized protein EV154DRAFT_523540 [Mucor mucedo]|uniref:uncharacterized protein n=1 Tax=Mucor mucedo TaxID=29922 RepID=UPI0022210B09|nr:uncharacterized protein EV154DRAFT_523540 [Mucor mucedo]KAI7881208.1 hypothetical protein EV154DRAFT_523540 [Mucor mucedo]